MASNNRARLRRDSLRVASTEHPGWSASGERVPGVGDTVLCAEGEAEVVRILGRTSDGSRLLELQLIRGSKAPYFAASSNVLRRSPGAEGENWMGADAPASNKVLGRSTAAPADGK